MILLKLIIISKIRANIPTNQKRPHCESMILKYNCNNMAW
jgi:hypothetical protein